MRAGHERAAVDLARRREQPTSRRGHDGGFGGNRRRSASGRSSARRKRIDRPCASTTRPSLAVRVARSICHRAAADRSASRAPRPPPGPAAAPYGASTAIRRCLIERHQVGVGHHERHAIERHAQLVGDRLRQRRPDVLTDLRLAGVAGDLSVLVDVQPRGEIARRRALAGAAGLLSGGIRATTPRRAAHRPSPRRCARSRGARARSGTRAPPPARSVRPREGASVLTVRQVLVSLIGVLPQLFVLHPVGRELHRAQRYAGTCRTGTRCDPGASRRPDPRASGWCRAGRSSP